MRTFVRRLRRLLSATLRRPDLLEARERETGIDFVYRFVLAPPVDEKGRARYLRRMQDEGMTLREVAAEIAASDEFQRRPHLVAGLRLVPGIVERTSVRRGEPIRGTVTLQNVGGVSWLPGSTPHGGVNLGVHLRARDGSPVSVDLARVRLEGTTAPGRTQTIAFAIAAPDPGDYLLEFDLVSEGVGWFEMNGSATVTLAVVVA